jgi:hypothetical protein
MNIGFVLQALHHRLERTVKSQVEVMEQLEKMKDENDDLKFQVCACLNYLIILSNHCTALIPTVFVMRQVYSDKFIYLLQICPVLTHFR